MEIQAIHTEEEYQQALAKVSTLFDIVKDDGSITPEGDLLNVLCLLIEQYEDKHYPIGNPEPVALIRFVMEQRNLTPEDMVPFMGPLHRVHAILEGRRPLTLPIIWRVEDGLGIDAGALVKRPKRELRAA